VKFFEDGKFVVKRVVCDSVERKSILGRLVGSLPALISIREGCAKKI